jgi:hypothetical protein
MRAPLQDNSTFEPEAALILAQAVDDTCRVLQIPPEDTRDREVIAARIVDLARGGIVDAAMLQQRVLQESKSNV